jgi:hypothetical protein
VFGRTASQPFNPSSVYKRALKAWAVANAAETAKAEEENRRPNLLEPIELHECRHTAVSTWVEFLGWNRLDYRPKATPLEGQPRNGEGGLKPPS